MAKRTTRKPSAAAGEGLYLELDLESLKGFKREFDIASLFDEKKEIGSIVYHTDVQSAVLRDPYRVTRRRRRPATSPLPTVASLLSRTFGWLGTGAVQGVQMGSSAMRQAMSRPAPLLSTRRLPAIPISLSLVGVTSAVLVGLWLGNQPPADATLTHIVGQNLSEKRTQIREELQAGTLIPALRQAITEVRAKQGDSVDKLAERYGISSATLRLANNLSPSVKALNPGATLLVPATNGAIHTIEQGETLSEVAERYQVSIAAIEKANPDLNPDRLQIGQKLLIPGATRILLKPKPKPVIEEAVSRGPRGSYRARSMQPVASRSLSSFERREVASGRYLMPTRGILTSRYGWRWGGFHSGIDVATSPGTPIVAAQGGTVISAGWEGGYGMCINISHGNGITTRYAHCSRLYVSAGQQVGAGQLIGAVGSTGHSTGPHLHFEVRINGSAVNPASYL